MILMTFLPSPKVHIRIEPTSTKDSIKNLIEIALIMSYTFCNQLIENEEPFVVQIISFFTLKTIFCALVKKKEIKSKN
jgi:hypothetical protein